MPKVVYLMLADPGDVTPADTFERWPTAGRTVAAAQAAGSSLGLDLIAH